MRLKRRIDVFICKSPEGRHVSEPKEPCTRVVVEQRRKTYDSRFYLDAEGQEQRDNGGEGWEIVREEPRCPKHVTPDSVGEL
jgi:hypothetical protein